MADTLERLDETVRSVRVLPDGSALVKSDRYYVRLCTDRDKPVAALDTPASSWLELRVSQAPDAGRCAHSARHRTLARVVASLQRELQADFIQWLKPETMLTREQFASAVETTDADRAKRRAVAGRR
ncbi:hypothetical protein, partial [Roseovarius sp. SYSU LYC5161]|uniref:hypothetical protein n=1 Tax=Roseovarius halophilus (ex Wu et al. 2025) TaxID=3376060 RepID=UPI00399B03CF